MPLPDDPINTQGWLICGLAGPLPAECCDASSAVLLSEPVQVGLSALRYLASATNRLRWVQEAEHISLLW